MPRRKSMRSAWASITEVRAGEVYRIRFWGKDADGQYRRRSKEPTFTKAKALANGLGVPLQVLADMTDLEG